LVDFHQPFFVFGKFLDGFKQSSKSDRATFIDVVYTSLATKLNPALVKQLAADVVDAVLTIRPPAPVEGSSSFVSHLTFSDLAPESPDQWRDPIDLHMVEIMKMQHRMATETQLIRGLVWITAQDIQTCPSMSRMHLF
jgi:T-complex protein 1 subunit zeta